LVRLEVVAAINLAVASVAELLHSVQNVIAVSLVSVPLHSKYNEIDGGVSPKWEWATPHPRSSHGRSFLPPLLPNKHCEETVSNINGRAAGVLVFLVGWSAVGLSTGWAIGRINAGLAK
jgi:hypothetical protein